MAPVELIRAVGGIALISGMIYSTFRIFVWHVGQVLVLHSKMNVAPASAQVAHPVIIHPASDTSIQAAVPD